MHTATIELPSRWQPELFADQVALARLDVAPTPEIESALDSVWFNASDLPACSRRQR